METQSLEKTFATHDEFNRKPIAAGERVKLNFAKS